MQFIETVCAKIESKFFRVHEHEVPCIDTYDHQAVSQIQSWDVVTLDSDRQFVG